MSNGYPYSLQLILGFLEGQKYDILTEQLRKRKISKDPASGELKIWSIEPQVNLNSIFPAPIQINFEWTSHLIP